MSDEYDAFIDTFRGLEIKGVDYMNSDGYISYPHSDPDVLHAPGECARCDEYPARQQYIIVSGMSFSESAARQDGGLFYAAPLMAHIPYMDAQRGPIVYSNQVDLDWKPMPEPRPGFLHNCVAHPLLFIWPRLGNWLHERTEP